MAGAAWLAGATRRLATKPGWRPDPHWPLPPPDSQWWIRDAPALPAATRPVGERTRRSIVTEMVVVAALVWLPWVVDGVIGLAQGVGGQTLPALPVIILLLGALFGITLLVGTVVDAAHLPNYGYGTSGQLPAYFLIPGWLGALAAGLSLDPPPDMR